jgi:hypothetical protein
MLWSPKKNEEKSDDGVSSCSKITSTWANVGAAKDLDNLTMSEWRFCGHEYGICWRVGGVMCI